MNSFVKSYQTLILHHTQRTMVTFILCPLGNYFSQKEIKSDNSGYLISLNNYLPPCILQNMLYNLDLKLPSKLYILNFNHTNNLYAYKKCFSFSLPSFAIEFQTSI